MKSPAIGGTEPIAVKVEAGKEYWWCACGLSKTQPFCDGSHKAEGVFSPLRWVAAKDGLKWFCACKRTDNAPFCDSSHNEL